MSKNKKIRRKFEPKPKKKPKNFFDPENSMAKAISWHLGRMELDEDSDWCWNSCMSIDKNDDVFQKLCDYERMKLSEVQNKYNHRVGLDKLNDRAIKELEKKKLNDIDCLHSFHINATTRFYCIPMGNIMKLLWFDPYHSNANAERAVCLKKK